MAQLILRPASDVSNSSFTPSSGSYIYATLNEVTADDSTLYSSSTANGASFTLGITALTAAQIKGIKTIDNLIIYARMYASGTSGSATFGITAPVSSTSAQALSTGYVTYSTTITVNAKPAQFDLNALRLYCYVNSIGTVGSDSKIAAAFYITQMYIVVNYTEKKVEMRLKINSVWKEAGGAYIKINGVWKEVDNLFSKIGSWKSG